MLLLLFTCLPLFMLAFYTIEMLLIFSLIIIISCFSQVQVQESYITYSPTTSVCVGDTVNITCYVYPPEGTEYQPFAVLYIYRNFAPSYHITINSTSPDYSLTGDIPIKGNSARIKLTFHSYQRSYSSKYIRCYGLHVNHETSYKYVHSTTPPIAVHPSPLTNVSFLQTSQTPDTCSNFTLNWSPDGVNTIDRYYLYRRELFYEIPEYVATTVNTQYLITDQLDVRYKYYYYIVASNCDGNSTADYPVSISFRVFVDQLFLSFDSTDRSLAIDWGLLNFGSFTYYLGFSLALTYNNTVGNIMQEKTDVYKFSQLSTSTSYYIKMNSDYTDGTNISACLEVIEQCGQEIYPSERHKTCTETTPPSGLETTTVLSILLGLLSLFSISLILIIGILISCVVNLKIKLKRKEKPMPDYEFMLAY